MTVTPLEWVLGRDRVDTMPPRRPASSQNSQANDDIPPPSEALPPMSTEGLYRYLGTLAGLVELQARAIGNNGQGQSSSTRGSSFDDFKKLGPPYFSGTSDPTEAEAWIMKIEKFFDVIDCSKEQKPLMLLEDQRPIVWSQFREAFYKKYFSDSFTELSRFAPQLIATEKEKVVKFQDGLKPYLKNKISILKLSVYSEVVDRALIAEKDNEELHQYREQQRKRNRNEGAHRNQAQRRSAPTCFGCGKQGHMIRDCPESKKFVFGKLKKENKKDRQKPRAQERIFAMTHRDAQLLLIDCCVMIGYREMTVDLVLLDLQDFDVILGMDWLASYHAFVDYFGKRVKFSILGQPDFSFEGKHVDKPLRMISALRANSLLRKGCQGFLAYVVNEENDLKLEDIPIVRDYPNVFPKDLPDLPPERKVEFTIDLNKVTVRNKYPLPRIDDLRWIELLKDYDCIIQYHRGNANAMADALSRKSVGSLAAIRGCQRQLLEDLRSLQVHMRVLDSGALVANFRVQPDLVGRIKALQKNDLNLPDFVLLDDGILRFMTRLCVPNDGDLRRELLEEAHCSRLAIHPRGTKMYKDLRQNYWWSGMKRDIAQFVAQCLVCQQTDGQSERVIQVLEDLLRACALDLKGNWDDYLPLRTKLLLRSGGCNAQVFSFKGNLGNCYY
ncbi:hypothetical protein AAG906_031808 [Vitis piasezkii]